MACKLPMKFEPIKEKIKLTPTLIQPITELVQTLNFMVSLHAVLSENRADVSSISSSLYLFSCCVLVLVNVFVFITRGTTSQRLGSISFLFFFHVAISDSVQWLPYLGFVPGPTRTTSKGLMSLLFSYASWFYAHTRHFGYFTESVSRPEYTCLTKIAVQDYWALIVPNFIEPMLKQLLFFM